MPALASRTVTRIEDQDDLDFPSFADREVMVWDVASGKYVGGVAVVTAAGLVQAATGSQSAPSLSFVGDPDTGFYNSTANMVAVTTGGVIRTVFSSTGLLQHLYDFLAGGFVLAQGGLVNSSATGNAGLTLTGTGTGAQDWTLTPSTSQSLVLGRPGLRLMMWDNSGNVAIGAMSSDLGSSAPMYFRASDGFVGFGNTAPSARIHSQAAAAGEICFIARGAASQSANLQEWQKSDTTIYSTVSENGYFTTRKVAAPADAELSASEVAHWLNDTAGAATAFMELKGKDSGGTVRTGKVALFQSAAYTPSNVTTDRSFDADTVLVAELADVVGTLIADLQAQRILG